jgi:tRNA modification GTPase
MISHHFKAASLRPIQSNEVRFGTWHEGTTDDTTAAESIVVVRVDALDSSPTAAGFMMPLTSDHWEIHCHGGAAATRRIIEDLERSGAVILESDAWQQACDIDAIEREATDALAKTVTERTAAIVLDQVRGSLSTFVNQSLERIIHGGDIELLRAEILAVLRLADFGLHLTKPWEVVLAGAPNVGKSSLINALVGYTRSIALDQPGTTRDVLKAHAVIEGWPLLLFDTAGMRDNPGEDIERQGIELARATIQQADLVIWVQDRSMPTDSMQATLGQLPQRSLSVFNKIDLHANAASCADPGTIQTSAATGEGLDQLRAAIIQTLIPEVPKPGRPVPICERQITGLQAAADAMEPRTMAAALEELRQK